jgi:hypothetical protein
MEIQRTHLRDQTSRLKSKGHVEGVGEENKYNGLVSRHERKETCGRPKLRRKINDSEGSQVSVRQ